MSDPTRKHVHDPRAGGLWVPGRFIEMRCDGGMGGCQNTPQRAPRLVVPPKGYTYLEALLEPGLQPIERWSPFHFCELHKDECTAERLLDEKNCRAVIEAAAKRRWPANTVPDFDNARVEFVLTTTPEYRALLAAIERNLVADKLGGVPLL